MIRGGVYLILFCAIGLGAPAIGLDHMAYLGKVRPFIVWGSGVAGVLFIVAGVHDRRSNPPPPSKPN